MKILYKFVGSAAAVRSMVRGSLKFTKLDELNDPSELLPFMNRDAVRSSLASIRLNGYTKTQFDWLGCQEAIPSILSPETMAISRPATVELANKTLALGVFDNMDLMKRKLLQTITAIRSRIGILSLTERFDSLPMWAHYGAQANGYVVRFGDLSREFFGDATGSLNALKPVQYVDDLVGMTHDPSTQDNLFFCKFRDWEYEREWRVVTALSACHLSAEKKIHLRSLDPRSVTGVICGWNVAADEINFLDIDLHRINPGLEIQRAWLDCGRVISHAL
jgi:Protein of unknown function (DUF2971)